MTHSAIVITMVPINSLPANASGHGRGFHRAGEAGSRALERQTSGAAYGFAVGPLGLGTAVGPVPCMPRETWPRWRTPPIPPLPPWTLRRRRDRCGGQPSSSQHAGGKTLGPSQRTPLDGSSGEETWPTPSPSGMVARRNVGTALRPTPDVTGLRGWITPDRAQARTDLSSVAARDLPPLRDSRLR